MDLVSNPTPTLKAYIAGIKYQQALQVIDTYDENDEYDSIFGLGEASVYFDINILPRLHPRHDHHVLTWAYHYDEDKDEDRDPEVRISSYEKQLHNQLEHDWKHVEELS